MVSSNSNLRRKEGMNTDIWKLLCGFLTPQTASVSLSVSVSAAVYTHTNASIPHTHISIYYTCSITKEIYISTKSIYSINIAYSTFSTVQVVCRFTLLWYAIEMTLQFLISCILCDCVLCMICLCKPFPCCPSSVLFASTSLFKRLPSSFWTSSFVESYWYCNLDKQWQSEAKERNIENREKI